MTFQKIAGKRICILGLSSTGKSTLAEKIAQKKGFNLLHLDQIHHQPNTQWLARPFEDFERDLLAFIQKDNWVIDGSYRKTLSPRFERADTVIVLKANRLLCLYRFLKRMRGKSKHPRAGMLEGASEQFSFKMVKYILFGASNRYRLFDEEIKKYPHLTVVRLNSFNEIDDFLDSL